jgi:DNA-directed RNA polymerase specialized sigma24 family protein
MTGTTEAEARIRRRHAIWTALKHYMSLRLRSRRASLSEENLVWLIDAEIALSALKLAERDILMARILGFSTPEIARATHMTTQRAERHVARALRKTELEFLARGVIRGKEARL